MLAPIPTAAATARALSGRGGLLAARPPDTTGVARAVLLASELVTNAVIHARTDLGLGLELRGDLLHLAVRDASPQLLQLLPLLSTSPSERSANGCPSPGTR